MIKKPLVPLIALCFLAANGAAALHLYQPAHEYTDAEVAELNWFELKLLASEPRAVQGHVFDEDWLMYFYLATDWYGPVHGTSEDIAAATTFTPKEERDMARFEEAAAELKPTYDGCWPGADLADLEIRFYRNLSSAPAPKLELPPAFYELGAADGVSVWSRPAVAAADAFAKEPAAGDYYRVYFRPDGGVAAAEAMRESGGKAHAIWKAWFDGEGALRLFIPLYRPDAKSSALAAAAFAGGPADTRPRCLISGDDSRVEMEVRGGPYARLPFTVILYEEQRDGAEAYRKLFGD
jgi:hypothetical protein